MRTIKCDICGKVIDKSREAYYSIEELSFNLPEARTFTVIDSIDDQRMESRKESWTSYYGIDLCGECWDGPAMTPIRDLLARRLKPGGAA